MGAISILALSFESLTGYFYYQGLQKKVMLLKELQALSKDGIDRNPTLKHIHDELAGELETPREGRGISVAWLRTASIAFLKWVSGAAIGLFAIMLAFFGAWRGEQRRHVVIGAVFFVAVFGTVAVLLPTIFHPAVNYVLLPLLQIVGLYLYNRRT